MVVVEKDEPKGAPPPARPGPAGPGGSPGGSPGLPWSFPTGPELAEFVPATVTLFVAFTREAGTTLTFTPVGLAAVTCPLMATSWPAGDVDEGAFVVVVVAAGLAVVLGAEVPGADVLGADVP